MTKKILLALALTLGTAGMSVPQALACGGYSRIDPQESAVRLVVHAFTQRQLSPDRGAYVSDVRLFGERASASLTWTRADGRAEVREVQLRQRAGTWRIVSVLS